MYIGLHVKYPLLLSYFNKSWILSTDFRKILDYQLPWQFIQWEPSCSMRIDRRTDMTKLRVAFSNICKRAYKKEELSNEFWEGKSSQDFATSPCLDQMNQIHILTHYLLTTILISSSHLQLNLSRCIFLSSFMTCY
jgi:hypothetical protein